ncbi:hypothetical protein LCGC14_0968240 [marine sediment metagenome]|uniref:Orotidine 5'-phosphate decarboxylase n=1 Tax=marine sediment metagenome TaxID=412755 RepID=A0A0F9NGW9_9ZZZZ
MADSNNKQLMEKVIVALDVKEQAKALELIEQISPPIDFYKVGLELYTLVGNDFVSRLKEQGMKVFLDLKLYDIPTTVSRAVASISNLMPDMITVHASGGAQMLKAAVSAAREVSPKTKVLAVTVLTSLDSDALIQIGMQPDIKEAIRKLAGLAYESGCDGIVCSAVDLEDLRDLYPSPFLMVTPGIRLAEEETHDQKRTSTPIDAIKQGADYLVIGRSISAQKQPKSALDRIFA